MRSSSAFHTSYFDDGLRVEFQRSENVNVFVGNEVCYRRRFDDGLVNTFNQHPITSRYPIYFNFVPEKKINKIAKSGNVKIANGAVAFF